jgi:hypothetical protein
MLDPLILKSPLKIPLQAKHFLLHIRVRGRSRPPTLSEGIVLLPGSLAYFGPLRKPRQFEGPERQNLTESLLAVFRGPGEKRMGRPVFKAVKQGKVGS